MILVELYSKEECHLCDVAHDLLRNLQTHHPFELRQIKLDASHERYDEFKERIPVIFINNQFAFQYRVPEKEFIARLREAGLQKASG